MRLVYEEMRDFNYVSGKEEFESAQLLLVCKSYEEFMAAWSRIKDIDGVIWSGCPTEDPGYYSDFVVSVKKERGDTIKDVKEHIAYLRKEINRALKGG